MVRSMHHKTLHRLHNDPLHYLTMSIYQGSRLLKTTKGDFHSISPRTPTHHNNHHKGSNKLPFNKPQSIPNYAPYPCSYSHSRSHSPSLSVIIPSHMILSFPNQLHPCGIRIPHVGQYDLTKSQVLHPSATTPLGSTRYTIISPLLPLLGHTIQA